MHLWRHSVWGRPHCSRSHKTTSERHSLSSAGKPLEEKEVCVSQNFLSVIYCEVCNRCLNETHRETNLGIRLLAFCWLRLGAFCLMILFRWSMALPHCCSVPENRRVAKRASYFCETRHFQNAIQYCSSQHFQQFWNIEKEHCFYFLHHI